MSSGGKYTKFPNKDRLQLGSASPGENYPSQNALASAPGTCRDWLCITIFTERSVPGELLQRRPMLVCLRCQHTVRNSRPPTEPLYGLSRAEAKTYPEAHLDSNKEASGRGKFLTFQTFSAGKNWMEKLLLNVLSVSFRRMFLIFTQTLSLCRKAEGLFNMPTQRA